MTGILIKGGETAMTKGLEVTIKYFSGSTKYDQVAFTTIPSLEIAILKKDLIYLHVYSPAQKDIQCINGSFVLHWPAIGTNSNVCSFFLCVVPCIMLMWMQCNALVRTLYASLGSGYVAML